MLGDEPVLHLAEVSKRFGDFTAVKGLSVTVQRGEVFCLLGPNGAGKTTTIRMITGLCKPTSGTVMLNGMDVQQNPKASRMQMGVLLSEPGLYDRLTALENVTFFAELYGLNSKVARVQALDLLEKLDMLDSANRIVGPFSKGMKQKVAIARALVHNPDLVIMDEPTNGLDVFAVAVIERLIQDLRKQGRTVIFSTHILSQVEKLADRVCVLSKGAPVLSGLMADLTEAHTFEETFMESVAAAKGR